MVWIDLIKLLLPMFRVVYYIANVHIHLWVICMYLNIHKVINNVNYSTLFIPDKHWIIELWLGITSKNPSTTSTNWWWHQNPTSGNTSTIYCWTFLYDNYTASYKHNHNHPIQPLFKMFFHRNLTKFHSIEVMIGFFIMFLFYATN